MPSFVHCSTALTRSNRFSSLRAGGSPAVYRELKIRAQSEGDLYINSGSGTSVATDSSWEDTAVFGQQWAGIGSITKDFRVAGVVMEFKVGDSYLEQIWARLRRRTLAYLQYPSSPGSAQAISFRPSYSSARTFPDPARSAARFSQLSRYKQDREVLQAMQLIEPAVQRIEVLSTEQDGPSVYVDLGLDEPTPLAVCGEGMVRLFAIAVELISAGEVA